MSRGQQPAYSGLADFLWGERPPATASHIIQTRIKHLRGLLEPGRPPRAPSSLLPRPGDGYALRGPREVNDLLRFRDVVAAAKIAQRDGHRHGPRPRWPTR